MVFSDEASLFTTLPLTELIKSFSRLTATSPPQGESKSVVDACAVPITRDVTCDVINLFKQNNCPGQSSHGICATKSSI